MSRRTLLRFGVAGLTSWGLAACGHRSALTGATAPAPSRSEPFTLPPGADSGEAWSAPPPVEFPVTLRSRPVFSVHELLPQVPATAVALTIDDGPHPHWTPQVLDLLQRFQVRATFSLVGVAVRAYPQLVRRIVEAGHGVCNHSLTHPQPFTRLPAERIERQIAGTQALIAEAAGRTPRLFRSPGGTWNRTVFEAAARHGLVPIDWDLDPRDWARPGTAVITSRLLRAKPGEILLCHDGGGNRAQTVAALTTVLPTLKSHGYTFLAL